MRSCLLFFAFSVLSPLYSQPVVDSLNTIRAFQLVQDDLASAGYVKDHQFQFVRDYGFSHVITLLPGDQEDEKQVVQDLGMTFTQIPVEWRDPSMENLQAFVDDMKMHEGEKVFFHCQANMRASAFMYVYRVTQLGVPKTEAKKWMDEIWYPTGTWHTFIEEGLKKYGADPEYRFESDFVKMIRAEGAQKALPKFRAERRRNPSFAPFSQQQIHSIAMEYYGDKKYADAIAALQMLLDVHPQAWSERDMLGRVQMDAGQDKEAIATYKKLAQSNPGYTRAKRMLGKLDVKEYAVYWSGVDVPDTKLRQLSGSYQVGDSKLQFALHDSGFVMIPPWNNKPVLLRADNEHLFFTRDYNWQFHFPEAKPGTVEFIMTGRTEKGRKISDGVTK